MASLLEVDGNFAPTPSCNRRCTELSKSRDYKRRAFSFSDARRVRRSLLSIGGDIMQRATGSVRCVRILGERFQPSFHLRRKPRLNHTASLVC
jgi:hypothetical protein